MILFTSSGRGVIQTWTTFTPKRRGFDNTTVIAVPRRDRSCSMAIALPDFLGRPSTLYEW
ncbi:hypothetical protein G7B40_023395 [Aetokthonos hydrillicola Thurmond2011]|uniref:Uncharacterized protein n=1 Tax=Aetokthonos hydrillicola Thurmond2011 TaxID=2712845 RepID=A0AAP5IC21_9CYAN|nr:hypothetical protein [Aetokthonos hydrillicola]MBW4586360.1 hypothetical protein [Aetokthonos hydrillicola CCALA 1050]MDR9897489.1 hypothetical protein [Aetokthonos hydrillicola Thurmond2011]